MKWARSAVLVLAIGAPGLACSAEIIAVDRKLAVNPGVTPFESGDRVAGGPAGDLRSAWDLLQLRADHELVDEVRLRVERGGKVISLAIGPSMHWGLAPDEPGGDVVRRRRAVEPQVAALIAEQRADRATSRWDGAAAEAAWQDAVRLRGQRAATSVAGVKAQLGLAEAALLRRDLGASATRFAAVDAVLKRSWPVAPLRYRALIGLTQTAIEERDIPVAEGHLAAITALVATVPVPVLQEIDIARVSGRLLWLRGDVAAARMHWERGHALALARVPDSVSFALMESSLGLLEWQQGQLELAERRFTRALAIAERDAPGSLLVAGMLNNLGIVYHLRRDYAAAARIYRRSADLFAAVSPTSPETVRALTNVALVEGLAGDPRAAIVTLQRVLAIQTARSPGSLDVAYTWHALGLNHGRLGELPMADASFSNAIAIREAAGLRGVGLANSLQSRGNARAELRQVEAARRDVSGALAIFERLTPSQHAHAESLHALGVLERDQGELRAAEAHFRRAIDVLDAQQAQLGGSQEVRNSYAAYYSSFYKDYADLLLRQGRSPEAFETLERYRGRVLRSMLADDRKSVVATLPAALQAERTDLAREFDAATKALRRIENPEGAQAEVERLLRELDGLAARRDVLASRIREAAPRLGELEYAMPLGVAAARGMLRRDTALVSFAVLPDAVHLLVVTPAQRAGAAQAFRSPIAERDLRDRVDRLLFLLSTPGDNADVRAALESAAHEMYQALLAPAMATLAAYPNWIVVPDGPLHRLPLSALVTARSARGQARPRYLVESHALTAVVSATVYDQLQRRGRSRGPAHGIAAFGDPRVAAGTPLMAATAADDALRAELARPLPWARLEVEQIGRLFGSTAEIYVGEQATETRVREAARRAPALHLASHGVLDERSPLDSFVLLASPAAPSGSDDDGRLTAREVFELPLLQASLVTLSTCGTSAAGDNDGEGLIGLTRAFQVAGADTVVSSLWKVSDRASSELMVDFYREWPRRSADEALARAQRRLLALHPFYWAAFQVSGARR